MQKILVWDWPVRIGHWLLAGAFILAWLTSESETWRLVHALAGGTAMGVIVFRLVWGFAGTRHARFASFVRGPSAVIDYVVGLLTRKEEEYAGHNAAGGWVIVALLLLGILTGASGWLTYQELGGKVAEELHEGLASTMLAIVLVHVAGVVVSSLAHRENLVRAMLTGRKQGRVEEAISSARPLVAVAMLVWVAACAWWLGR